MSSTKRNRVQTWFSRASRLLGIDVKYFLRGGGWLLLPIVLSALAGLARSIFFARLLTKNVYGQFGFVNDTLSTLGILTLPGLSSALMETVARGNWGAIFDAARARARWGMLLTVVVAGVSAYYLLAGQTTLARALLVGGVLYPQAATFRLVQGYYNGRKRFDWVGLLNFAQILLNTGSIFLALWLQGGLLWLVVANYGSNLLLYASQYWVATRDLKNAQRDPTVVAYGRSLTWAGAIMDVAASLDGVLLGIFAGFSDVAVFRVASVLPKIAKSPIQILKPLVLPKIAEHPEKKVYTPRVRRQLLVLWGANLLFVGLLIAALCFLVPLLYGKAYRGAVVYAQLLTFSLATGWPNSFFIATLQARKHTRALAQANLVYGVLLLGTMLALTPLWGITGIVISRIVARWGGTLFRWRAVVKL